MPKISYVFGDILTGKVIEEIALQGVSMTRGFGQGEFRGTFNLDQTGKDNRDLMAATEAGRCFLVCERDSQPIWDGFVWTRTYQSQSKTLQLFCKSLEHYPEYRYIRSDFENLATEQRNIFRNLWTSLMATPNTPQITIPSSFATVISKSLTIKEFEFKTYRQGMDVLANGDDGFDWTIDTSRVGGAYTRTLRVGYPTLGSVQATDFDYPGSVLNYWENDSMASRGTHFYGIGAGEGSTMLTQEVIHSDLISSGFPRYDVAVSLKEIINANILTSLVTQIASTKKPGLPILTLEVRGDQTPEFGSYGLGDIAKIHYGSEDPRHPDALDQTFTTRILGWNYYPQSDDHVEFSRLVFDGEGV